MSKPIETRRVIIATVGERAGEVAEGRGRTTKADEENGRTAKADEDEGRTAKADEDGERTTKPDEDGEGPAAASNAAVPISSAA